MFPVTKTPRALEDLAGIALYISQHNPDAAMRFLDAAEETFELLSRSPYIGARLFDAPSGLADFRASAAEGPGTGASQREKP